MLESLFNKFVGPRPATLLQRKTPTQVFSCKFLETFKNTFFDRTPPLAASELYYSSRHSKVFLKMSVFRNFTSGVSFLIKFKVQVFAFDFGEIFKNTFCTEHLWTTAYIANNLEHFDTQVRNSNLYYTYHLS